GGIHAMGGSYHASLARYVAKADRQVECMLPNDGLGSAIRLRTGGDTEAFVTVKRTYDDLGGFNKIDMNLTDPKIVRQSETEDGLVYLNGNRCIDKKTWFCPNDTVC